MIRFFILILLIIFALIGTYETDKAYISEQLEKEIFYRHKSQDKNKYALIVAGDSRSLYGLDPYTIATSLNLKSAKSFAFLSNSYTPSYVAYLSDRLKENSHAIIPISYESLTSLEADRSFQIAKANRFNLFKFISQYIQYCWPGKKILQLLNSQNQNSSFGKEKYQITGEIDRLKNEHAQTKSLENHYLNILRNFKIDLNYVKTVQEMVQSRKDVQFYFFHICFLDNICKKEEIELRSFFEMIKKFPNVKILNIDQKFTSSDGDHLDEQTQIKYSKYISDLITN